MFSDKSIQRVLLIVIPLYFTQGWLFDHGSVVSQVLVGIWLLIDLVYLFRYFSQRKFDAIGITIILFWAINAISWVISPKAVSGYDSEFYSVATYSVFKNISVTLLTYFPFRFFFDSPRFERRYIECFSLLSFISLLILFFTTGQDSIVISGSEEVTNNGAYYLASIVPLLGIFFNRKISSVFLAIVMVLVLLGAKRGAIVCVGIELLLYVYFLFKKSNSHNNPLKILGILIILSIFVYLIISTFNSNDYLQYRYNQTVSGDSSLRNEIYASALASFSEGNAFELLFGHGMCACISEIGMYAHQDWLELLVDNGIVGTFLYFIVFICLYNFYRSNRKVMTYEERFIYLSALFCFLLRSSFSMGYTSIESSFLIIALVYVQSSVNQRLTK